MLLRSLILHPVARKALNIIKWEDLTGGCCFQFSPP